MKNCTPRGASIIKSDKLNKVQCLKVEIERKNDVHTLCICCWEFYVFRYFFCCIDLGGY